MKINALFLAAAAGTALARSHCKARYSGSRVPALGASTIASAVTTVPNETATASTVSAVESSSTSTSTATASASAVTAVESSSTSTSTTTATTTSAVKTTSVATKSASTTTSASSATSTTASGDGSFTFFGCSESGLEFGSDIPGTYGTTYTNPLNSSIQTLNADGFNTFRIPFLMERLTTEITGDFNEDYLELLVEAVDYVTGLGAYAVLDPHNYGRFNGEIISSTDNFQAWWKKVATEFADNDLVVFDTNNEYHDMDESLVVSLNQAAIDGIRSAGAKTQYIFVEGNSYTGAWTWTDVNTDMSSLTDTEGKIIYEMHQYLDSDGSGTSETCVSSTIGKERVEKATAWLKENGKVGVVGEFAGGNNDVCKEAVSGMLDYLSENSDVWAGALWWSAGPWWGSYMYSMEPSSGPGYEGFMSTLKTYSP